MSLVSRKGLLLVLLAVWSLGCPGCETPRSSGEKVLRLGVMGPFTGPAARTGEEFRGAALTAFETVGYRIGEYRIELVWIDEQSDPQKGAAAYEEAVIRNGIEAGILNWHSSVAVAAMEMAAKYKVPHFFGMGATEVVNEKYRSDTQKYGYWMVKGWPVPEMLTAGYVQAVERAIQLGQWKPASRTAAIWGEDTDWGRSLGKGMRERLQSASWNIIAEEYFPLTESDYYPLLRKFKDSRVRLLAGTSTSPSSVSAFIKQAREVGVESLIIADGLGWAGEWYSLTGDASDGVLDQIPGWNTEKGKRFATEFEKRWGFPPSPAVAGLAFDYSNFAIKISTEALRKYGRIDRETLYRIGREDLTAGKLVYTDGIVMRQYRYTPESTPDPVVGNGYFMFPVLQYRGGRGRVIWPPESMEADLEGPG